MMITTKVTPDLKLQINEVCFILDVTRQTVYNMQQDGRLSQELTISSVQAYLDKQQHATDRMRGRLDFVVNSVS